MVLLALLSVVLIATDHRLQRAHQFRLWMETSLHPLQQLIDLPGTMADWLSEGVTSRESLQEENASLQKKSLLLQQKLQRLEAIEAENSRLKALLGSSFSYGDDRVLIAETLSVDLASFNQEVLLNKGSSDGVYVGQPIVDANGIMGQIIRVTPISSTALLISSSRHSIPVQNRRNGLRAIATGIGHSNQIELRFLPTGSDLIPGDTLITSGLGGRFPFGYPVGTVESVDHPEEQPFVEALITPAAALDRSREVLLVWPASHPSANGGDGEGTS